MKDKGIWRHAGIAFLIALLIYIVAYGWIEHRRHFRGAWRVVFTTNNVNEPVMIVNQPHLKIEELRIEFRGRTWEGTASPEERIFDTPKPTPFPVPFGKVIFMDLTFLPGTVTFDVLGYEIELLPRTLIIEKKEIPWSEKHIVTLEPQPGNFTPGAPW